ncbi:MAG TPA: hypothetical protein VGD69_31410, partial [Herpetosiphonaceae bacterium]
MWKRFRSPLLLVAVAELAVLLVVTISIAQAAPLGRLRQFRVPTANSDPKFITPGADGNLWFTESDIESPNLFTH